MLGVFKRSVGISFQRTQHRIPLPVERSLCPQYILEQAVRDIGLDQGDLLELLGLSFNDPTAVYLQ